MKKRGNNMKQLIAVNELNKVTLTRSHVVIPRCGMWRQDGSLVRGDLSAKHLEIMLRRIQRRTIQKVE
jgi:hypothetical protein